MTTIYPHTKKLNPSMEGPLLHDVVAISGLVKSKFFEFVHRTVNVDTYGDTKGQTFADFSPLTLNLKEPV